MCNMSANSNFGRNPLFFNNTKFWFFLSLKTKGFSKPLDIV